MQYDNIHEATFLRRLNRFVAEVEIDGRTERRKLSRHVLELEKAGAVHRVRRHRHMVLAAQDVVDLARRRAARSAFEEYLEAVGVHPPDRLLQAHRRHPLLRRRVARLARLRRQRFRCAAAVHGNARAVVNPVPRELAELRKDLPAPGRVERTVHGKTHSAHPGCHQRVLHLIEGIGRNGKRKMSRRLVERNCQLFRRKSA